MDESNALVSQLLKALRRPSMYGTPEGLEARGMHSIHICLQLRDPEWQWEATQALWRQSAQAIGFGDHFVPVIDETETFRKEKWGRKEAKTKKQLVEIYQSLWATLKEQHCDFWPATTKWLEHLLNTPASLGSPDQVDHVLWYLIAFACPACVEQFRELYIEVCISTRGSGSQGFRHFNTRAAWRSVTRQGSVDTELYNRLNQGILFILNELKLTNTSAA